MQQLLAVRLAGRPVAEDLPRPVVDEPEGPLDLLPRHPGEVRPLREELPDQAVGVLVRALLLGVVGLAEVELDAPEPGGGVGVRRELLAPVGRDGLEGPALERPHLGVGDVGGPGRGCVLSTGSEQKSHQELSSSVTEMRTQI